MDLLLLQIELLHRIDAYGLRPLAHDLGWHPSTVKRIVSYRHLRDFHRLTQLADALRYPLDPRQPGP
jgi:hypothetical protein